MSAGRDRRRFARRRRGLTAAVLAGAALVAAVVAVLVADAGPSTHGPGDEAAPETPEATGEALPPTGAAPAEDAGVAEVVETAKPDEGGEAPSIPHETEAKEGRPAPSEGEPETPAPSGKSDHAYAGAWRGRKKTGGTGIGAVTLVAPSWGITAAHVASKKERAPESVNVTVRFGRGKVARVAAAFTCPEADIALVRFEKPVEGVQPVALLGTKLAKKHDRFLFTFVSRAHGLKVVPGRTGKGNGKRIFHSRDATGGRPGKAGDSGGAWLFETPGPGRNVQFAVIHGGGFGPQPAAHRAWVDKTMAPSGESVTYAPLPKLRKPQAGTPDKSK